MIGAAERTNVQSIDDRLWDDVKQALDRIDKHAEDILAEWVFIGQRLWELRERNPSWRGAFGVACRMHGIALTENKRSAAMWWAQLDDRQRDVLSEKNPTALTPETLQDRCRERYPEWAKIQKPDVSRSTGRKKNTQKTILPTSRSARSALPATTKKQIEAEVYREELIAKRERRAAAEAAAKANDRRPTLTPGPSPVVMYGMQLWPVTDAERIDLGHYDYDQLATAVWFFIHQRDVARMSPGDTAKNLRLRTRFLHKFVEARLVEPGLLEMRRFLQVIHLLCRLYEANPEGECKPPSDRAFYEQ